MPRADRPLPGAGREVQPAAQRRRRRRSGRRAAPGARRRRRAREGKALGPAPRRADDGEGVVRRRRHAHDVGPARAQRQPGGAQCARRGPPARRRRRAVRQDQRAAHARRLPELQRRVRHHQQPVGPRALAGRLLGRLRGGARRRAHGHRGGQRHRLVDPQSRALLRRLRPQADLRHRAAARPGARRACGAGRHLRHRPHGARRRGSRPRALRDGGRRRDRRRRVAAPPARAAAEAPARVQGRRHAHRSRRRGRSRGAGPAPGPRRLPRREEGAGERPRAPRHRHGRGPPRVHPAPPLRHLGPADGRRSSRGISRSRAGSGRATRPTTRG